MKDINQKYPSIKDKKKIQSQDKQLNTSSLVITRSSTDLDYTTLMGPKQTKEEFKFRYQEMMSLANEAIKREITQVRKYLSTMKKGKEIILPLMQNMINMVIKFQYMKL